MIVIYLSELEDLSALSHVTQVVCHCILQARSSPSKWPPYPFFALSIADQPYLLIHRLYLLLKLPFHIADIKVIILRRAESHLMTLFSLFRLCTNHLFVSR